MTEAGVAFLIPVGCGVAVAICFTVAFFAEKVLDIIDHFRRGY